MAERVQLEPAFVLHQRPFRETSLLLEILTPDFGRVGLVARGARRRRAQWRGILQPFVPLLLSWSRRGDLGTLSGAEAVGAVTLPIGERLLSAFYINELMLRLVPRHDANSDLFLRYREALAGLHGSADLAPVLRIFEKHLLQLLGYGLVLDHDVDSGVPIDAAARYRYIAQHGPVLAAAGKRVGVAVRGATLLALAAEQLSDEVQRGEARLLLTAILDEHVGPRPLATRELLRELRGEQQPGERCEGQNDAQRAAGQARTG